jgi:uncharacterized protein (DUF433 family)
MAPSSMSTMTAGVADLGLYSIADAVRYSRIPNATVRRWLEREGRGTSWRDQLVSFDELISLLFVREFRKNDVRLADIIAAERDLRERYGWEHPFVREGLWTAGGDVLVRVSEADHYFSANRRGQIALKIAEPKRVQLPHLVQDVRGELGYVADRVASWRPVDHVVARPATQFGLTCIEGTRIPTLSIFEAVSAGDRPAQLAQLYGVANVMIEKAVEWERQLAA